MTEINLTQPEQFHSILYYPYINLPKQRWIINAALYYDKVGIISPKQYDYDYLTREFIDTGLAAAVDPTNIHDLQSAHFYERFITIINHPDFNIASRVSAFNNGQFVEIYLVKFNLDVLKHLEKIGVAAILRPNYEIAIVETITANVYMQYLATNIGASLNFTPTTNRVETLDCFRPINSEKFDEDLYSVLDELFPIPLESDYKRIADFKDKHYDKLSRFRQRVEEVCIQSSAMSPEMRKRLLGNFKSEAKSETEEILDYMKKFNFLKVGYGAIKILVPIVTASTSKGLTLLDLLPKATSVIDGATKVIDNFKKDQYHKNKFYYAALIQKEFEE